MTNIKIENYIRDLYCSSNRLEPIAFRTWALAELIKLFSADAGLWGTGNFVTYEFHHCETIGLDEHYGAKLRDSLTINPISQKVLDNLNQSFTMSEVYLDDDFFTSQLFHSLFEPYGIKRLLATAYKEQFGDLYSLVSLYRFDVDNDFTAAEKSDVNRLTHHLVAAASHNYSLNADPTHSANAIAICDKHGYYWYLQPEFIQFLAEHDIALADYFPYKPSDHNEITLQQSKFVLQPMGKLYKISARLLNPLDCLSQREVEVASWVIKGLTFKEAAKEIGISPSTVSNHLYRIYSKLGISRRGDLSKLFNNELTDKV